MPIIVADVMKKLLFQSKYGRTIRSNNNKSLLRSEKQLNDVVGFIGVCLNLMLKIYVLM